MTLALATWATQMPEGGLGEPCPNRSSSVGRQIGIPSRETRERANVGLRELARYIQVSPSSLSKYERGQSRPNAQVSERWAQALAEMQAALLAEDSS